MPSQRTLPTGWESTEKLALKLEEELFSRCNRDPRIEKDNDDDCYSPGKQAIDQHIFCVYIAYRYATEEELQHGPVICPPRYSELEAQLEEKSRECQELEAQLEEKLRKCQELEAQLEESRECQDWEAQVQELKDKLGDNKDKVKVKEEPVKYSATSKKRKKSRKKSSRK